MPRLATRTDSGPTGGTKSRQPAAGRRQTTTMNRYARRSSAFASQLTFKVRRGPGISRGAAAGRQRPRDRPRVTPCQPTRSRLGIRFVRDVDVTVLIDLAPHYSEVPDLFDAYCRRSGPVALPDFLRALATALASGWLVSE